MKCSVKTRPLCGIEFNTLIIILQLRLAKTESYIFNILISKNNSNLTQQLGCPITSIIFIPNHRKALNINQLKCRRFISRADPHSTPENSIKDMRACYITTVTAPYNIHYSYRPAANSPARVQTSAEKGLGNSFRKCHYIQLGFSKAMV